MSQERHRLRCARLLPAICILVVQGLFLLGCEEATTKDNDNDEPPLPTEAPIQTVVESVAVNDVPGVFRSGAIPAQSGGPSISVSGNSQVMNGGAFFVTARSQTATPLDTLIVGLQDEDRGYYEVDLRGTNSLSHGLAATTSNQGTTYQVRGQVSQDIDDDFSIVVIASDASGVGAPEVHHFELVENDGDGDAISCADYSAEFTLSPPSWIHGTWSVTAESLGVELLFGSADELKFTFTAGRLIVLVLLDGTNVVADDDRLDLSVTEENATSTEYSFVAPPGNGVFSERWVFTRTSSSSIEWAIMGGSRVPLSKIDSC